MQDAPLMPSTAALHVLFRRPAPIFEFLPLNIPYIFAKFILRKKIVVCLAAMHDGIDCNTLL